MVTSPKKVEGAILARMPDGYVMKIAFPQYRLRPCRIRSSVIRITNIESGKTTKAETELGEDISAIAVKSLENRKARIPAKAIARATTKYLANATAEKEYGGELAGDFVGLFGNIASVATEQADLRCWKTLPAEIRIGRCNVAPGNYRPVACLLNSAGRVVRKLTLDETSIKGEETKFLFFRTID